MTPWRGWTGSSRQAHGAEPLRTFRFRLFLTRRLARDDGYCGTIAATVIVFAALVMTLVALVFFAGIVGVTQLSVEAEEASSTDQAGHCVADIPANQPDTYEELAIPKDFYDIYRSAGEEYDIPWFYLAAVGWVETKHGQWKGDGTPNGLERGEDNGWGAAGPMQFGIGGQAADTWSEYGVDGNGDGRKDVYDPRDAIPAAGNLISEYRDRNGTVEDGLHRYNPGNYAGPATNPYVYRDVLPAAESYDNGDFEVAPAMGFLECVIPEANEEISDGVVTFVENQVGKPYASDATGPDEFGSAGLVHAAYADQNIDVPEDLDDLQNMPTAVQVSVAEMAPGDVVLTATCDNTNDVDTPATHAHVVTGDDTVVNANRRAGEVIEDDALSDLTGCRLIKVLRMSHLNDEPE